MSQGNNLVLRYFYFLSNKILTSWCHLIETSSMPSECKSVQSKAWKDHINLLALITVATKGMTKKIFAANFQIKHWRLDDIL